MTSEALGNYVCLPFMEKAQMMILQTLDFRLPHDMARSIVFLFCLSMHAQNMVNMIFCKEFNEFLFNLQH